ncbi:MAG: penicillin-binding protein 1C [Acidobacteria bacterium]|nr:penicillin-binding protein 1C [Acidobacteriota bacterium]
MNYRHLFTRRRRTILGVAATAVVAALWVRLGALPEGLLDNPAPSTVVVDRRGVALYEARAQDGTRGVALTPDTLPPHLVSATIAAEDRRFWSHPGVDPISILRAMTTNLAERSVVEGGSTISQQVAKLLLNRKTPDRRRGWRAKVHEAVIAIRLERRFAKRELLAMYLNLAGYGNQISGVERASRAYFGSSSAMLTPAQAALLAGLPQRPSGFNPYKSRTAALSRQQVVLRRMHAEGSITREQLAEAQAEQLPFKPSATPFVAPHFVEMVLASEDAAGPGRRVRIETTLDAELQADVMGVIASHREALRVHGAANVAVVVLDNRTGEWLAWEGSGNYTDGSSGGAINGPLVPRQPGSALKPFTYALAFENGFSPASVLADVPLSFPTAEPGIVYSPRNYDGRFRGPMLARAALAGSENVPAVSLASTFGVPSLLRFLGRAGLGTFDKNAAHYGLGLTLGNAEVRLDELAAAYSAFARGGEWIEPSFVTNTVERSSRRLISDRTAFWITDILSDGEAREFAFGRGGSLEFPFPVAVKTGTSQAYRDNWTIGYSKHVTVGVWVGNFDRTPLRNSSGVTGAAPIFHGVMLAAERRATGDRPDFGSGPILSADPGSTRREICALSGQSANAWCPNRRHEWVATETQDLTCSWHHDSDEGLVTILPVEYQGWATGGSRSSEQSPARRTSARGTPPRRTSHVAALAITSPADGSTYLIDPTLRREFQSLSLKAVTTSRGKIEWTVDGEAGGSSTGGTALDWPLVPGKHRIEARDGAGHTAQAEIIVR